MSEESAIDSAKGLPVTYSSLLADFASLGVKPGMNLLAHSSLSSLGWVCGGAVSVIKALEAGLGPDGTLVMPAHSSDISDPAHWGNPAVPESWWDVIRNEMPEYNMSLTPTRDMGKIAETFRKQDGVKRSGHPSASFCAYGKNADYVLQDAHYDYPQNEKSPLGRLYELDGFVLLLGVGHDKNTSLHLAEHKARYPGKRIVKDGFPLVSNGTRAWHEIEDILYYADDFPEIGKAFEATRACGVGYVGNARSVSFSQRALVDFAVEWMEKNRDLT